jgi:hypothetical protein
VQLVDHQGMGVTPPMLGKVRVVRRQVGVVMRHLVGVEGWPEMHCVKLLGQRLSARDFDRQVAEFQVRVAVLNRFTALGTPLTEVSG